MWTKVQRNPLPKSADEIEEMRGSVPAMLRGVIRHTIGMSDSVFCVLMTQQDGYKFVTGCVRKNLFEKFLIQILLYTKIRTYLWGL